MWAGVGEAQQEGKLLLRTATVPVQTLRQRCGSCRGTRSESARGGAGEEAEGALRPSEPPETYPTETCKQTRSVQLLFASMRTAIIS